MTDHETYRAWKPEIWPTGGYELGSLTDNDRGLTVVLEHYDEKDSPTLIEIAFPQPRAYRMLDEGFRLKQWSEQWSRTVAETPSAVYVGEDTWFLNEFYDLSLGVMEGTPLIHYFIVTNNVCVDVIADAEPHVRIDDRRLT